MEWLDDNLEEIKKKNRHMYDCLAGILKDDNKTDRILNKFSIIQTRNGENTVEYFDGEKKIRLNSVYNPEREAIKWTESFQNISKYTSVVMFGLGNGIFYKTLNKQISLQTYIFLYEPDVEMFLFCLLNFDMTDILSDDRVFFYVDGINSDIFLEDMSEKINWAMMSTQLVCFHPMFDKIYKEKYLRFEYMLEQFKSFMIARKNTSLLYAKKFTVNALKNLRYIKESNYISELIGRIDEDISVIIVSAGPSLDKNISMLKKAEKRAFILAVDTAVKYLLANDIEFDAIVTIDGRKSLKHFEDERCNEYPLFTVPDAKSDILEKNQSRKIWMNGSGYMEILYEKYNLKFPEYVSGGSVATAAFWIAQTLNTKNIIFVGQDLSYAGEVTHAGNVKQSVEWTEAEETFVEGINGEKVKTRADWLNLIRWFENAVQQLKGKIKVIDATEGGAKIAGTIVMPLSEAIEKYCIKEFDFDNFLADLPTTFNKSSYNNICKDICHIEKEFAAILKASQEGYTAAEKNIKMLENKEVLPDKLETNQNVIMQSQQRIQTQKIYMLLDEYISADIEERLNMIGKSYDSIWKELLEKNINSKILFEALEKAVNELQPVLNDTLNNL